MGYREKQVKTVRSSAGRVYHYHRPTSARLPDDVLDSPKALKEAIDRIEKEHRIQSAMPRLASMAKIPETRAAANWLARNGMFLSREAWGEG